jgi:ABC-type transport system substrate-binding protein
VLAEPSLRKAIACIMGIYAPTELPFESFALQGPWQNVKSPSPCSDLTKQEKIQSAVGILTATGYSWLQEPTSEQAGSGLVLPNGRPFPQLGLLTILPEYDRPRANAAIPIHLQLQYLGIPVNIDATTPDTLRYAVYSSGDYDMAILGYRVSAYPGYLCEWFQTPSPFEYGSDRLKSACQTMTTTADLETARHASNEVQSILLEDLPFIPLYQVLRYEAYQNVTYPFDSVLDGISGLYGAPSLAIPAP